MKRRDFLADGAKGVYVGLAGLAGLGARPAAPFVAGTGRRADLVVRGGTIHDGTGAPPRLGDIAKLSASVNRSIAALTLA